MSTAIWWIRRDLRLTDNLALAAALDHASQVIPAFIVDPWFDASPYVGDKRRAFLWGGLRELDAALRQRGGRLIVRHGEPAAQLARLRQETGAGVIFAEADHSPYARRRDAAVAVRLPLRLVGHPTVHPPAAVVKADGQPYVVFTPFSRAWKSLPLPVRLISAPACIFTPVEVASDPIPSQPALPASIPFPPGEVEAQRRLAAFTGGETAPVWRYAQDRNRLDREGVSQLSPYFRFGMISARQAAVAAYDSSVRAGDAGARQGAEVWLDELIWREFYAVILYHFPDVLQRAFRAGFRTLAWSDDEDAFGAWCEGRTGYPVVDAAMRQLVQTGWMHNRARMITASFLVKDLLIDWRWGERFFAQHLLDGDPAANNGGWQWTAGVGTDAAPYFRMFNPVSQGAQCDPDGVFIRRWLPELAQAPAAFRHAPWRMPAAVQAAAGCAIGRDYPAPIVDHGWARARVLAVFGSARGRM